MGPITVPRRGAGSTESNLLVSRLQGECLPTWLCRLIQSEILVSAVRLERTLSWSQARWIGRFPTHGVPTPKLTTRRAGRAVSSFHFVRIVKERRIPPLRVRYCKPGAAEGSRTPKILLLRQACMPIPSPPRNRCPSLRTLRQQTPDTAHKQKSPVPLRVTGLLQRWGVNYIALAQRKPLPRFPTRSVFSSSTARDRPWIAWPLP
jgi:hypothetical protein